MTTPALTMADMEAVVIFRRQLDEARSKIEATEAQQLAEAEAERRQCIAIADIAWRKLADDARPQLPEFVRPFIRVRRDEDRPLSGPVGYQYVIPALPFDDGEWNVYARFESDNAQWMLKPDRNGFTYSVHYPYKDEDQHYRPVVRISGRAHEYFRLEDAIVSAEQAAIKNVELRAEVDAQIRQRNEEMEKENARAAANEAAAELANAARPTAPLTCSPTERAMLDVFRAWFSEQVAPY